MHKGIGVRSNLARTRSNDDPAKRNSKRVESQTSLRGVSQRFRTAVNRNHRDELPKADLPASGAPTQARFSHRAGVAVN